MPENEEKILEYWDKNDIFRKTLEKDSPRGDFVFYDGPPFATGLPHYGHIIPGTIKDIIPRYKTMMGYKVRRRWGWDCHGLPIENIIEKELSLSSKKDIIDYGLSKFNESARNAVLRYSEDWKKIIPRLGRWVDMNDDYRTMDKNYTESVWWAFSNLHKKGLIYEGYKVMNLCPRCETTLSNFEVTQGYKDITDISIYVKFESVEDKKVFFLAWTTTPWTLPGNSALAVNPDQIYVEVKISDEKIILMKSRLHVLKTDYEINREFKGSELVGKKYRPPFTVYSSDKDIKNNENGWKIYSADFVTDSDGSGIVHIAPAFGADDYALSQKHNFPVIHHVMPNGQLKDIASELSGRFAKPKDDHQSTDVEIIKYLASRNLLVSKEKIIHSYPHCWRCETPLLNYATSSWFVKVTSLKTKLVEENKKVSWVPKEIGESRFGNWLEGARDWSISRSRFWGAPIPVWKDKSGENVLVLGSIEDLKKYSKSKNNYFTCRHGEAENNSLRIMSTLPTNLHALTEKGKKEVLSASKWLKSKKIDIIYTSPFLRTRETAEIIADSIGLNKDNILIDARIRELNAGKWEGKKFDDFVTFFDGKDRFAESPEGGENYAEIKKRVGNFIYEIESKYEGKNILIISHDTPLFLLHAVSQGYDSKESMDLRGVSEHFNKNGEPKKLDFQPLPVNEKFEIDFHRPYIDSIQLRNARGEEMKRIPDVFDCWFESGSMPFAEAHYPFDKENFNPKPGPFSKILGKTKGFPADFIAEGLDQTRGWFYSMMVLGVALFGKTPFKNVVVNGLVLAEDGQKMSKSKQNFPDISILLNKYGADALRYYLMSSPVVRAQDLLFSEKGVEEVAKKHIGRLINVLSFYELYSSDVKNVKSSNILDKWLLNRLNQTNKIITENLEKYEIDRAVRPIADFVDDLSTWYVRRSRDRFKSDDNTESVSTLRFVLSEFSKILAPFMPFTAEFIYRKVGGQKESVHLEDWPEHESIDMGIINDMQKTRDMASIGLDMRTKNKINVRQPLSSFFIKENLSKEYLELIKDEVNVKEVVTDAEFNLNILISDELKEEGDIRELMRSIQELRKEKGLTVKDKMVLHIEADKAKIDLIQKYRDLIMRNTGLNDISFTESSEGETKLEFKM